MDARNIVLVTTAFCVTEILVWIFLADRLGTTVRYNRNSGFGNFTRLEIRKSSCFVADSDCASLTCPDFDTLHSDWMEASNDSSVYVYSAYSDGRNVTILGSTVSRYLKLFCQIWGRTDGQTVSLETTRAKVQILPEGHHQRNLPCYFSCSATRISKPLAVSLVVNVSCSKPLHSLPVLSSPKSPRSDSFPWKFTTCVAPLRLRNAGNELVEWIEFNRILGTEHFVFYNYSIAGSDSKILRYYSKLGLAEVLPWTLKSSNIHYFGQMVAINDCVFRHRNNTKFVVIVDLDEIIIPRLPKEKTWIDMFQHLPQASSYIFRNILFPKGQWPDTNDTRGKRSYIAPRKYDLITMTKLQRLLRIWPSGKRSKAMHDPRSTHIAGIHFACKLYSGGSVTVNESIGLVHHYRAWKLKEMETDTTVLKYQTELRDSVENAWKAIT